MLKLLFVVAFIWCALLLAPWVMWRLFRRRPRPWVVLAQYGAFLLYGLLVIFHTFYTDVMRFAVLFSLIPPVFWVLPGPFVGYGLIMIYSYAIKCAYIAFREYLLQNPPTRGMLYAVITAFVLFVVPKAFFALCCWLFL